jgi:hypothetical protein
MRVQISPCPLDSARSQPFFMVEFDYMKNLILKIAAFIFAIEGVYLLYKLVPTFLKYYQPDSVFLIPFLVSIVVSLFLIISAIGIFLSKNWSIVFAWLAILLPFLLTLVLPSARVPVVSDYRALILNVLIAIYLTTRWNKLK